MQIIKKNNPVFNLLILILAKFALVTNLMGCGDYKKHAQDKISKNIIGGAVINDSSYADAIVFLDGPNNFCTGIYIGNNKVLTAAHCNIPYKKNIVQFKRHQSEQKNTKNESFFCDIAKIDNHPNYVNDNNKFWYDISLVTVDCKNNQKDLQKIKFYDLKFKENINTSSYLLAGFGYTRLWDKSDPYTYIPSNLSAVELSKAIFSETLPSNLISFFEKYSEEITSLEKKDLFMCAKTSDTKTDYLGDSGGPVYILNEKNEPQLLGIISVGLSESINTNLYMSCFAPIKLSEDWIKSHL